MARSQLLIFIASLIFSSMSCYALKVPDTSLGLNITQIQKVTGQIGEFDKDEKIYKITVPRDDLKILISGIQMTPDMGLSSWIAFKKIDNQTLVNGDLVLLQDQINPVMSVALTNGLQVTGLHNPYLWDSPRVMFMHIEGEGDELQLTKAVGQVLKKIKATSDGGGDFPLGNFEFFKTTLDPHKIDVILGQKGQFKDDIYKVEFSEEVKATDTEVNKVMALNTWAAFAGSDNEAVVNGTVALSEPELQKALIKLRSAQMYVLSIYRHAINNYQDLVLINFWGVGTTQTLAKTLHSVFSIAQESHSTHLAGEVLPTISPVNAETEIGTGIPSVQLSLLQKDNCSYIKARELYTLDILPDSNMDYAKQLSMMLHKVLYLTGKIVSEKMTALVDSLPASSSLAQNADKNGRILPSTKELLLKFSTVSTNVLKSVKPIAPVPVTVSLTFDKNVTASKLSIHHLLVELSEPKTIEREMFSPSARMMLAKLSVVEQNNFEVLSTEPLPSKKLSKMFNSNRISIKSYIHLIPLFLSAVISHIHVNKDEFVLASVNTSKSLVQVTSSAVTQAYAHISEFLINLSRSLVHAKTFILLETAGFFHSYTDNFILSYTQSLFFLQSKVMQMAQSAADRSFSFSDDLILSYLQSLSFLQNKTIQMAQSAANQSLAFTSDLAFSYTQSLSFLQNKMIQMAQSAAAQSFVLTGDLALSYTQSLSFLQNKMIQIAQSAAAHSFAFTDHVILSYTRSLFFLQNKVIHLAQYSIDQSLAFLAAIFSQTASLFHSYADNFIMSYTQSLSFLQNEVTQLAQFSVSQSLALAAEMAKPDNLLMQNKIKASLQSLSLAENGDTQSVSKFRSTLFLLPVISTITKASANHYFSTHASVVNSPVAEKSVTIAMTKPAVQIVSSAKTFSSLPMVKNTAASSHDPTIKSLSAALSMKQNETIVASSTKILPASLPMPQHKVIRVAALSSIIPVTQHKVRPVSVVQYKSVKIARVASLPLPHPSSSKNHGKNSYSIRIKSVMKPPLSLAYVEKMNHKKHLSEELPVILHTVQHKQTEHALSRESIKRHPVYFAKNNVHHLSLEKITEKPREMAHAIKMSQEKNWNVEKLAPAPRPPVRVARRHVYHAQEEVDDGPAMVGYYPYDEEPTPGGFGG